MPQRHTMLVTVAGVLTACSYQPVSFDHEVRPILNTKCGVCHQSPDGRGYRFTGLQLDSYDSLIKGTVYGPVVVKGDSRRSILNMLVEGRIGKMKNMPHIRGLAFTENEIEILRVWVDQGALNN